jgi:hypothetical protein
MKLLASFLVFGFIASAVRVVNFDNAHPGKTPPGWTIPATSRSHMARWEVRSDRSAPTPPYVLAQVATDLPSDHYPLAIWNGLALHDGEVSVRIKPVAGHDMQCGGIVWRYRDENNYYLVRANALDNRVQVVKVQNGHASALVAGVRRDIPVNAWSILKVWVRGNRFQVYMDHRRILQGQDNTFTGSGRVGLWTMGDSVTYFDDFRVSPK